MFALSPDARSPFLGIILPDPANPFEIQSIKNWQGISDYSNDQIFKKWKT